MDINIGNVSSTKICYLVFEQTRESATKLPDYKSQAIGHGYVAKYCFDDIVTHNEELANLKRIAELNAAFDSSVLILGESGTGKELFAQAIHNASERKDNPFVAINCAAVAESLLESELFGYDEGAFTGARRGGKKGLFELAHCGTLFLDEIGEMQVHLQARLLRVLQEKEITHIGGDRVIGVDVRVIAATNRDIKQLIRSGSFRKDLFYRLNAITLKLPNLSERKDDVPFLEKKGIPEARAGDEKTECERAWNEAFPDNSSEAFYILEVLDEARQNGVIFGRRGLAELSQKRFKYLSEMKIRLIFSSLKDLGLITVLKGRGGTRITEKGAAFHESAHYL